MEYAKIIKKIIIILLPDNLGKMKRNRRVMKTAMREGDNSTEKIATYAMKREAQGDARERRRHMRV